jgi:hypothetical protein
VAPPQFANLLFYCIPPSLRGTFASVGVADAGPETLALLGKAAPRIKDRMQKEGVPPAELSLMALCYVLYFWKRMTG